MHLPSFPFLNLYYYFSSLRHPRLHLSVRTRNSSLVIREDIVLKARMTVDILDKGRSIFKVFLVIRCRFKFETMRPPRSSSSFQSTSPNLNCKIGFSGSFYLWGCPPVYTRPKFIRIDEEQQNPKPQTMCYCTPLWWSRGWSSEGSNQAKRNHCITRHFQYHRSLCPVQVAQLTTTAPRDGIIYLHIYKSLHPMFNVLACSAISIPP